MEGALEHDQKVNFTYIITTAIVVFLSFFLHELSHWGAGELCGMRMGMSLNNTYGIGDQYTTDGKAIIVIGAGPLFTLVQATVFFFLLRRGGSILLYPALFTPFYMRLLAGVLNIINLNDEGKIGNLLRIGIYTIPAIVTTYLFYLVYKVSREKHYSAKFNLLTLCLVIFFSSVLILTDMFVKVRII